MLLLDTSSILLGYVRLSCSDNQIWHNKSNQFFLSGVINLSYLCLNESYCLILQQSESNDVSLGLSEAMYFSVSSSNMPAGDIKNSILFLLNNAGS